MTNDLGYYGSFEVYQVTRSQNEKGESEVDKKPLNFYDCDNATDFKLSNDKSPMRERLMKRQGG